MASRQLTQEERDVLFKPLFDKVLNLLKQSSKNDKELLWALQRKLRKEVMYLERGSPNLRRRLKEHKRQEQKGRCASCGKRLPIRGAVLDRLVAINGYTKTNTRLLCPKCDAGIQALRKFK